jgi:hypothetical protein
MTLALNVGNAPNAAFSINAGHETPPFRGSGPIRANCFGAAAFPVETDEESAPLRSDKNSAARESGRIAA